MLLSKTERWDRIATSNLKIQAENPLKCNPLDLPLLETLSPLQNHTKNDQKGSNSLTTRSQSLGYLSLDW